jgi:hypothetical protein
VKIVRLFNFPTQRDLKHGDALSPLLFNSASEYAIRKVKKNQVGLILNGTHQLLAYADIVKYTGRYLRYHEKKKNHI